MNRRGFSSPPYAQPTDTVAIVVAMSCGFVLRLKVTEMPLAEIKKYADLRAQGEMTLDPRLAMLKLHRERLVAKIEELSNCASVLDEKISVYQEMIVKARTRLRKDTK